MRTKSRTSWLLSSGLTLVEVLAGTAILGTLLVAILVAGARMTGQKGRTERHLQGCRLAGEFMENWWPKRSQFPRNGEGDMADNAGWRWRTRTIENEDAGNLHAQTVRLEIFAPREQTPSAQVEILLPENETSSPDRIDVN